MTDSTVPSLVVQDVSEAPSETNNGMNGASNESQRETLADLTARATALYAIKKYNDASELYSEATELQADINGEMAEDNAELLFAYGRCLFYVAQQTSTVLGGTAASTKLKGGEKKVSKKRKANGTIKAETSSSAAGLSTTSGSVLETADPADVIPAEDVKLDETKQSTADKPFFHIEGDAPDWDSDSDQEDAEAEEGDDEEDEEEDDFNTAFEILDLSRILFLRKLENLQASSHDPTDLKPRIAEIYDLQAEISLEGEKFDAAVTDLRSCLELKEQLYQPDNAFLAECHYKLSLALEAACQVQQRDQDGNPIGDISIDWTLRNEAVQQQEKAIESCKLRIAKQEEEIEDLPADQTKEKQKRNEDIEDVQDMIQAMEQRLEELRKPPVSVKAEAEKDAQQELMGTVLGQLLGAGASGTSQDEQKAKLSEIMAGANDLSGAVKRKKPKPANGHGAVVERETEVNGKGKRKIEETDLETTDGKAETIKKVRIEDVID